MSKELAHRNTGLPKSRASQAISVGELERRLLGMFGAEYAEEWDRTGLVVGNRHEVVTRVAVALDPTVEALTCAHGGQANVLVTHHPVFLDPPEEFHPAALGAGAAGSVVYEAARHGMSIISFHTSLDVNPAAARVLPKLFSLNFERIVCPINEAGTFGYGQLCSVATSDEPMTLTRLAARCLAVTGKVPRVWGSGDRHIESVVTATGSASNLLGACLDTGVDCLVCGEVRYHDALSAAQSGLCIVELGHDVSELPLCTVLADAVEQAGIAKDNIAIVDQGMNWWTPEASRK